MARLHTPRAEQSSGQRRCSHATPPQPAWQAHMPSTHSPCELHPMVAVVIAEERDEEAFELELALALRGGGRPAASTVTTEQVRLSHAAPW